MIGQVCGRLAMGTSSVILTSNVSGNGTANIDEGSIGFSSGNSIGQCIGHLVGPLYGWV